MDPLSTFLLSVLGAVVLEAIERPGSFRAFYPDSASRRLTPSFGWKTMSGRGVDWNVEGGLAVWVDSRLVRPISGNIFDHRKLGSVAKEVRAARRSGDRVPFTAGYGQISKVDVGTVQESLMYDDTAPFTTGDRELDRWLSREQEIDDEEEIEELQERLADAVANNRGDLGSWHATVRDGNHRTFGAILGGEERVAVRLYDNDVQGIREALQKVQSGATLRPWETQGLELLTKAIQDTGAEPEWLGVNRMLLP